MGSESTEKEQPLNNSQKNSHKTEYSSPTLKAHGAFNANTRTSSPTLLTDDGMLCSQFSKDSAQGRQTYEI